MSDSDPKDDKASAPADEQSPKDEPAPETPDRATTIEQARKFLASDEIRDADTDKKIAFLEQKGLEREEIDELLGVTRNPEASSSTSTEEPSSPSPSPAPTSPSYETPPPSQPQTQTQLIQSTPSQPPIITYPEFLTTSTSSEPLVTRPRLLTTLYLFSSLSLLLYGTSNFVVTPMLSTLTESRLSLASTAKDNLQKLIDKLESVVSVLPPDNSGKAGGRKDDKEGEESEDEDPTELFHRDIGVQTSLPASPSLSPTIPTQDDSPSARITQQTTKLSSIRSSLNEILETSASEGHDATELEGTIGILREYLDSMAYAPSANYGGIYGSGGLGGYGNGGKDNIDDEIARVKSSIRGVKGVLLSAKSFPGGVRAGGSR